MYRRGNIIRLLQNIDVSKSSGPHRISGRMLKGTAHSIAPSITKLFNISITLGCLPQTWKLSSVVPIPKSADNTSPTNYRPISLLSVLSKLLEWHMYSQITSHLETHHPLSTSQWGFQSGRSTVTALLETTHNWFQFMDAGKEVGAVFFRSTKGFWLCTALCPAGQTEGSTTEWVYIKVDLWLLNAEKAESGSQWPNIWNSSGIVRCASRFCDWAPAIPHLHRWGDGCSSLRGKRTNCICWWHTAVQTNHMPGRLRCTARGYQQTGLLDWSKLPAV